MLKIFTVKKEEFYADFVPKSIIRELGVHYGDVFERMRNFSGADSEELMNWNFVPGFKIRWSPLLKSSFAPLMTAVARSVSHLRTRT